MQVHTYTVYATASDLIRHVFPAGCHASAGNMDACILTTLNKHVDEMNATIQARAEGEERTYKSADFFGPDAAEEAGVYPVEVLNTLTSSGMAPHQLTLRVGAPVVFLRNLDQASAYVWGGVGVKWLRPSHPPEKPTTRQKHDVGGEGETSHPPTEIIPSGRWAGRTQNSRQQCMAGGVVCKPHTSSLGNRDIHIPSDMS